MSGVKINELSSAAALSDTDIIPMWQSSTVGATAQQILDYINANTSASVLTQNIQRSVYTLVATDAGKHLYHPADDPTARTWTIPGNSSVSFEVGTVLTFVNHPSGGIITIACDDTMWLGGSFSTGNRTLAAGGVATAVKVAPTLWVISGTGLT